MQSLPLPLANASQPDQQHDLPRGANIPESPFIHEIDSNATLWELREALASRVLLPLGLTELRWITTCSGAKPGKIIANTKNGRTLASLNVRQPL